MKTIEEEAARFENTRVYIHRRSKKEGSEPDGRYVRIGGIFKLDTPDLKRRQYLGIHNHLFVTLNYPDYVQDFLAIAADLPGIEGHGNTTWVHLASCSITKHALWYFIPSSVWGVHPEDFKKTIKTTTTVSIVKGIGGGIYHILNFPLLTRNYLRERYKK